MSFRRPTTISKVIDSPCVVPMKGKGGNSIVISQGTNGGTFQPRNIRYFGLGRMNYLTNVSQQQRNIISSRILNISATNHHFYRS